MAKVIRGGARVIPRAVVGAKRSAEAIVEEARAQAAVLRETIRAEVEAEATEAARAEFAAAMIRVEAARNEAVRSVEGSIVELAIAVARKLVCDELEARPERVRALVQEAMSRVARAQHTLVRAHPDDLHLLEGLPAELVADASLERGDCVVESDLGDVDGRIETKIARTLERLGGADE